MRTKHIRISEEAHEALKELAPKRKYTKYVSALIIYVQTNDFNFKLLDHPQLKKGGNNEKF